MNPRQVLVSGDLPELRSGNEELDRWVEQHLRPFASQTFAQLSWAVGAGEQYAYKTSSTSRDNTVTLTADPDLTVTLREASVYKLELQLLFKGEAATSGNQGFNFAMGYTGTLALDTDALGHKIVNLIATVHTGAFGAFGMSAPIPGGVAPITTGAPNDDGFHATWLIETLTAGTLSVDWAQAVSGPDDTILRLGSYLIATRLSQ